MSISLTAERTVTSATASSERRIIAVSVSEMHWNGCPHCGSFHHYSSIESADSSTKIRNCRKCMRTFHAVVDGVPVSAIAVRGEFPVVVPHPLAKKA